MHDAEGNPIEETIPSDSEFNIPVGEYAKPITDVVTGIGKGIGGYLQDKYNDWTGKGEIPEQERTVSNPNYSGMNEVVDWMQEQERSGRGRVGFEGEGETRISAVDVLERMRQPEESRDPNVPSYDPEPSSDDIERKAMMFSNVFDAVRSNKWMGMDARSGMPQDYTEEKRARFKEVFNEQGVPEEWQNEFFEALRAMRPAYTQGDMSGRSGTKIEKIEAGQIDTPTTSQNLQIRETPITMPETQRRGIFRRRR
jgi:hypothetical protein